MDLQTVQNPQTGWEAQLLNNEVIKEYWPHIKGMLERVPHTWTEYTIEDFYNRALSGYMQVWGVGRIATTGVVFSQIVVYPTMRVLQVVWGCGEGMLDSIDVMDAALEAFAKSQDCKRIDVCGRIGWEKFGRSLGYKRTAVILSRPVHFERTN